MKPPQELNPDELEERIHELLKDVKGDRRSDLFNKYFPLAEAWRVHYDIVKKNGVIKQYGNVRNYAEQKFNCSYELIRKSLRADEYKPVAEDAMAWLDGGCHAFDTDEEWNLWRPKKVWTPDWIVEVGEAFHNRHDPMPVKEPKKVKDEGDGKLVEPMTVEESTALLSGQLSEIARLGTELEYERMRVRVLEDVLIEHRIPLPEAELTVEMQDLLDGLTADVAGQIVKPPRSEPPQIDIPPDEPEIVPVVKSRRGGARPGAGRKKKPKQEEDSPEWIIAATDAAWRDIKIES